MSLLMTYDFLRTRPYSMAQNVSEYSAITFVGITGANTAYNIVNPNDSPGDYNTFYIVEATRTVTYSLGEGTFSIDDIMTELNAFDWTQGGTFPNDYSFQVIEQLGRIYVTMAAGTDAYNIPAEYHLNSVLGFTSDSTSLGTGSTLGRSVYTIRAPDIEVRVESTGFEDCQYYDEELDEISMESVWRFRIPVSGLYGSVYEYTATNDGGLTYFFNQPTRIRTIRVSLHDTLTGLRIDNNDNPITLQFMLHRSK